MDRGAWRALVQSVTESDKTEATNTSMGAFKALAHCEDTNLIHLLQDAL